MVTGLLRVLPVRSAVHKVTSLPKPVELTFAHIDRLKAIADELDDRADALRRNAAQIRRHAASLEVAASRVRRNRNAHYRSRGINR